ncbi:hypothetical protein [Pseudarthrobacter sp. S9]|uniref:hypothetical protein n=1 Tax=Pseudarthrobacter sp. S9 TaxID=3418421 RepID=UPI003D010CF5
MSAAVGAPATSRTGPVPQAATWQNHAGETVEIVKSGHIVRRGIVEEEMPDGSGLWLAADAADRRENFHKSLGFELWV